MTLGSSRWPGFSVWAQRSKVSMAVHHVVAGRQLESAAILIALWLRTPIRTRFVPLRGSGAGLVPIRVDVSTQRFCPRRRCAT